MQTLTLATLLSYVKNAYEDAERMALSDEHRDPEHEDHIRDQAEFGLEEVVDTFKYEEIEQYSEWLLWAQDYTSGYVADLAKAVECEMAWQMQATA